MKLQMPTTTLFCIDCLNADGAIKILERCKSMVDFADVKLLTNIPVDYPHRVPIMPLNSLVAYSVFMLTRFWEYIDTAHVLIVQRDGWILNADAWNPAWINLDYIGPLFVQYDKVGSGGFSFRSRSLMWEMSKKVTQWDGTQEHADKIQSGLGYYEDGIICLSPHSRNYKISSNEQAADFAHGGNRNPLYFRDRPFGFHRTFAEIDFNTGVIDYSDLSKDLHSTYDHIL